MRRAIFATILLASSAGFTGASFGQETKLDIEALRSACKASADDCATLVLDAINQLKAAGLTEDELNTQVAVLAAEVIGAASETVESHNSSLASVLADIAALSSDANQASSILNIARGMESGRAPNTTTFATPVAASPA